MREEAAAAAREKPKAKKSKRAAKPSGRMKAVWGIKNGSGAIVKFYAYPHKAVAEAEAARMRDAGERGCLVCPHKVPIED